MDFFDEKDIAKLINAQDKEIEAYIKDFKAEIERQLNSVSKGINSDQSVQELRAKLNNLSVINLPENIKTKLDQIVSLYQSRIDIVSEMLKQAGVSSKIYNATDTELISQIIETDKAVQLTTIDQTYNQFKQVTNRGLLLNNLPSLEEVNASLADQLSNKMETDVRTQLAGFQRAVHQKKSEDFDLNFFLYAGGLIKTSREFCIQRAGKVFPKSALDTWDNGQGLPANPYLGGYNCRHTLVFMTKDKAEELGISEI